MMIQQENSANAIAIASAESKDLRDIPMKPKDISFAKTLRPVYKFSRAFGLMPFTITVDEHFNFKGVHVKPLDVLWCITSISLCIVSAIVYYRNIEIPKGENVSIVLEFGDSMLLIVGLIYACTVIIMDMINRGILISILKSLNNFDNSVCVICFCFCS